MWQALQRDDDVRCIVLAGAGERAFCVGIDHDATIGEAEPRGRMPGYSTPWEFDDPGRRLGPKANHLWKPVIAAVDGIACGGAFYLLGEADFIVASEPCDLLRPARHLRHDRGLSSRCSCSQKMPLQEVLRMALLGARERVSAQRAYEVGLVSQVVAPEELAATVDWAATAIASSPTLNVQGTLRAIWMANEVPRSQMLELSALYTRVGTDPVALAEGQATFAGKARIQPRIR